METKVLQSYKGAAAIWKKALNLGQKKAKDGALLLDIAESIEKLIIEEGAKPAFPVNLSINEEAAHFTPKFKDKAELKKSDLLKIDIGVAVDGYICDGAFSVNLDNKHAKQIEANELALKNAISKAEFGKPIEAIGAEIEKTLNEKGFEPVRNLGGHGLEQYNIHAKPNIPNHSKGSTALLEEGVIAIEPFASTGKGAVGEVANVEIFSFIEKKGLRNIHAREMLMEAEDYGGLPFAQRWLMEKTGFDDFKANIALRELLKAGCFHAYPGLREAKGAFVSQAEKSLIILEDETIVLGE